MPKICCLSDQHGLLPDIDPCDILLIAGDICPTYSHATTDQLMWLNDNFRHWLEDVPAGEVIAIAGNHDFIFQEYMQASDWIKYDLPWSYLEDTGAFVEGYWIWGSPWQPPFYDWAFNLPEDKLAEKWAKIPDKTEILLTHGPPYKIKDLSQYESPTHEANAGSKTLVDRVMELSELKLHVFGHIHPAHGEIQIGETLFVNASYVDNEYNARPWAPTYITLPDK